MVALGEILQAQETREVRLYICTHPGASRNFDGSLLSKGAITGDVIATHPTIGDNRGAVNEGGVQSNGSWGTQNYWGPLIEVPADTITSLYEDTFQSDATIPCTLNIQFRINNRVAVAQYGPCIPSALDQNGKLVREENDRPLVSVRVWLNNTRNPDHERIPCVPGTDHSLPGQTEPVPFIRPPGLPAVTTTVGETVRDTPEDGDQPDNDNGEDGPIEDEGGEEDSTENGDGVGNGSSATDNGDDSSTDDSQGEEQDEAEQQEQDEEESEQLADSQDSQEADAQAEDMLESEEDGLADEADLLEQETQDSGAEAEAEAEVADGAEAEADEDVDRSTEETTTRPRVPRTGSGGIVGGNSSSDWPWFLGGSLAVGLVIAALFLVTNRRSNKPTEQ